VKDNYLNIETRKMGLLSLGPKLVEWERWGKTSSRGLEYNEERKEANIRLNLRGNTEHEQ
jgi:hypothetical protein